MIQKLKNDRVEVGRSNPTIGPPASDVVKIRVYKRNGNTAPSRCVGVVAKEVRFRAGDIVVRDTSRAKSVVAREDTRAKSRMDNLEATQEQETSFW